MSQIGAPQREVEVAPLELPKPLRREEESQTPKRETRRAPQPEVVPA